MDQKNTVIAVVLSLVVLLGWNYFYTPKTPKQTPVKQTTQKKEQPKQKVATTEQVVKQKAEPVTPKTKPTPTPAKAETKVTTERPNRPARLITVDNGLVELVLSEDGGRLVHLRLINYGETNKKNSPRLDLIKVNKPQWAPLDIGGAQGPLKPFENAFFKIKGLDGINRVHVSDGDKKVVMEAKSADGLTVTKTFTIKPHSYLFGLDVDVVNNGSAPVEDNLVVNVTAVDDTKEGGHYAFRGFGAYKKGELSEIKDKDLKDEPKVVSGEVEWGGYENSYFMQTIIPAIKKGAFTGSLVGEQGKSNVIRVKYTSPQQIFKPGDPDQFNFLMFFGPKRIDVLNAAGLDLDRAMNMGWFDILAKPFLYFLRWVYSIIGNYGVAIILLTVGVKLIFFPLTQKSYKSMRKMQDLQPQMAKLREQYKDDKQRMNKELMGLYKARGVNPMGGCLPMVVQIPVFIALYRLLDYAIELRHAPFMFWITDLSAPDRLFRFPFHVPMMDPPYGVPVMTLLMGVSMFIQQKMTPTPGDPTQAKMMLMMPVVFTFIFINFPSGLVLYWFVNNVLSIGQQYWINKGGKKVKA